jgi:hypothetical protein
MGDIFMAKKKKNKEQVSLAEAVRTNAQQIDFQAYDRNFNPDYSDVIKDLKRIGILASVFFVILIGLSFVL